MPTPAKVESVTELTEAFTSNRSAVVSDYRGLTMKDLTALRRTLREQGIQYRVVKNRLARIAAEQAGLGELGDLLQGPTAIALGGTDETQLARVFLDAVRPYRTIAVRGGVVGNRRFDAEGVTRLSTLPTREVLLAQLAGGIASPMTTMANLFQAPLRNLAYAFAQLAEQRGGGTSGEAAGAAASAASAGAAASA